MAGLFYFYSTENQPFLQGVEFVFSRRKKRRDGVQFQRNRIKMEKVLGRT